MLPWDEIRGKIKETYDKIESAYNQIEIRVGNVKEHRVINTVVRIALPNIPIVGLYLRDWYDNTGGADEEKTTQILQFLENLQQQNELQFQRISEDLKTNLDAIITSKIEITQLTWKRSTEILEQVDRVRQDTTIIRHDVKEVKEILNSRQTIQISYASKPSTFRGEKRIFIGRQNYIDQIKEYFRVSNAPISIIGLGGIGKTALAFKVIHQCEDMFDLIIPVYFTEIGVALNLFLSTFAKSLAVPIGEFDKLEFTERKQFLLDMLGRTKAHPLIFVDSYETISGILKSKVHQSEQKYEEAVKINGFLKGVPPNTSIILTSQLRKNLDGEREIQLGGLSLEQGSELFIQLAGANIEKPSGNIGKTIEKLIQQVSSHPLSIEILAKSYEGSGLEEIERMCENLGLGLVNPEEQDKRLRTLEASFMYSINNLEGNLQQILSKLTFFKSPFPRTRLQRYLASIK